MHKWYRYTWQKRNKHKLIYVGLHFFLNGNDHCHCVCHHKQSYADEWLSSCLSFAKALKQIWHISIPDSFQWKYPDVVWLMTPLYKAFKSSWYSNKDNQIKYLKHHEKVFWPMHDFAAFANMCISTRNVIENGNTKSVHQKVKCLKPSHGYRV